MRVEYINPFTEASYDILAEVLGEGVRRDENLYLKANCMPVKGVAAFVGLAGDVEGRVVFDMTHKTALGIALAMNKDMDLKEAELQEIKQYGALFRATITELANMITARAVTALHDLGFRFDLTPPALFTGDNMQVSMGIFKGDIEALIVPMTTPHGKIEINVAIHDKDIKKRGK